MKIIPEKEARPLIAYNFDVSEDEIKEKFKFEDQALFGVFSVVFKSVIDEKPYFVGKNIFFK